MQLEIQPTRFGSRSPVQLPDPQILIFWGEEGIRQLVSDHYDLLATSEIQDLFPTNPVALEKAKEHSADFFIQVMGGPAYFNENRGKPMLVQRHARFRISNHARIIWLECYRSALQKTNLPDELLISFWNYLNVFSNWMVNTPG